MIAAEERVLHHVVPLDEALGLECDAVSQCSTLAGNRSCSVFAVA